MPIRTYVQRHLVPQLALYGLTDDQLARVAEDVQRRLVSLLSRWNDREFRRTLLVIGQEEASYYEPRAASLETRSLVVVAVRNSALEDLSSTPKAARQLGLVGPVLPDRSVPTITGAAIEYFGGLDLARVSRLVGAPSGADDVFGLLPRHYPITWRALTELATSRDEECSYEPVAGEPPAILLGRPMLESWQLGDGNVQVLSGMEVAIEPPLQKVLRLVKNGVVPALFADSFKMITRNPEKLCRVIEFALGHGRPVVTHNYYLTDGLVTRRVPLLRPAHTSPEVREKFQNHRGLCPIHERALCEIVSFL